MAKSSFTEQGIKVFTETGIESLQKKRNKLVASINGSNTTFDAAILSVGVQANIEGLGLDQLGVELERGFVSVDEYQQTSIDGIFAIGDVSGVPVLLIKLAMKARSVLKSLLGKCLCR